MHEEEELTLCEYESCVYVSIAVTGTTVNSRTERSVKSARGGEMKRSKCHEDGMGGG